MRFESLMWTVLALFIVGGAAMQGDTLGSGASGGGREYQSADGGIKIPPGIVDGGSSTAPVPLTK